jgi:DNA invertase Pin-like site-specific DNA recombinase
MAITETWAGIVRVSSVGGRNGDAFHSDEDQVADVNRYVAQRAEVVFMEPELSVSGGKAIEDRPPLLAAIEGVEAGIYTGIVVANLRRLSRSRSGQAIWDRVEGAGGHVHCAAESLDTSTPNGRFIRDIHLASAVREREEMAEQFANRRRKTVENGIWRQRQTPRGYIFKGPADDDGKFKGRARLLVPGSNADEVRQAFRDRATATAISEIARRLKMTPSGVRMMLSNRVYLGELRDGDFVNPAAHEPLVTVQEFDAVQHSIPRPARRAADGPALLAGLVRCAGCGHRMPRKSAATILYACRATHGGDPCPAPAAIYASTLDSYVEPIALAELSRLAVTASEGRGVHQAEAELATAQRELDAFLLGVQAAGLEPHEFAAAVRARRKALDAALGNLRAEHSRHPAMPQAGLTGADAYLSLDATQRNLLLHSLLSAVIVARAGKGKRVPIEDRVRVVAFGADVQLLETRHGEHAAGIAPIALPNPDDPGVLR